MPSWGEQQQLYIVYLLRRCGCKMTQAGQLHPQTLGFASAETCEPAKLQVSVPPPPLFSKVRIII
jgi:hypothetical protein